MIVITGAAGFIGSNVVAALNAEGNQDLIAVDTVDAPSITGNLNDLKIKHFVARDELLRWMEEHHRQMDALIHLGACSDTFVTDREFVMRNNFDYSRMLWDFCARQKKRFVYASSAATYGDGSAGYDDNADPNTLKPLNLYGESKHRFDLWALAEARKPAGWAGLKFFNVYGPRERHKGRQSSVVLQAYDQVREQSRVKLFKSNHPEIADGAQKRDFIYVKDTVAAILHFMRAPEEKMNALFNVGTGQARSFAELASAVFLALHQEPRIDYIAMPANLNGKYQYFTQAVVDKLRRSGFTHQFHSLEEGVAEYVKGLSVSPAPFTNNGLHK